MSNQQSDRQTDQEKMNEREEKKMKETSKEIAAVADRPTRPPTVRILLPNKSLIETTTATTIMVVYFCVRINIHTRTHDMSEH